VTIKTARAALSHSACIGISRNHLDRLVAELADPFDADREGGRIAAAAAVGVGAIPARDAG
jgi:hypothetical protein